MRKLFFAFVMLLPLSLAVCGILCSIVGSFLVRTEENATQDSLLKSLRNGTYTAAALSAVCAAPLTYFLLDGNMGVYAAILAGLIGGCVATFGMVLPSIVIITLIAKFISNFSDLWWVQKALTGINVAVAAILTYAVVNFSKKSVKNLFGFVLLAIAFVLIFVFKVGTVYVIFGSAILGVILAAVQGKLKNEK